MLATVGFIAQERAHFLFVELLTFAIGCAELYRALNGWIAPTSTEAGKVTLELPDGALRALRGRVRGDGDQGAPARPPRDARGRGLLRAGAHRRQAHPRRHLQDRHLSAHSRAGDGFLVVKRSFPSKK